MTVEIARGWQPNGLICRTIVVMNRGNSPIRPDFNGDVLFPTVPSQGLGGGYDLIHKAAS